MKIQLSERILTENEGKLDFQAEMKCKTCFPANCCLLYEITLFERALTQNGYECVSGVPFYDNET